jgi:ATP-dependent Lon protease
VKPVGGIIAKVEAAKQAGAERVLIPKENMQSIFMQLEGIEVIPVERIETVFELAFGREKSVEMPVLFSPTSAPV